MTNQETASKLAEAVKKYVPKNQQKNMMLELLTIDGPKPFREAVAAASRSFTSEPDQPK